MAFVTADRVRDTTTTTGTGAVTLSGTAPTAYRTFGSVMSNSDTCLYAIQHQNLAEWEVGVGTYSTTGPALTRTTVIASSNAGAAVSFSAGTKDAFITLAASKVLQLDGSGNFSPSGAIATLAQFLAGTTNKLLLADIVWSSQARQAGGNTGTGTVTPDMAAGTNWDYTCNGNFTLGLFTNVRVGMKGSIKFTQDGTGSRTWTLNSGFKSLSGSAATLSTAVSAIDRMDYEVMTVSSTTATRVEYALAKGIQS